MRNSACLILLIFGITLASLAQDGSPSNSPTSTSSGRAKVSSPPSAPATSTAFELKSDASGNVPQSQMSELLRKVAENDMENYKRSRDYTYVQREEERHLDGKGDVKKVESRTSEILMIYGDEVERLIAKDDKPLSEKEAGKQDEKIQKIIDKRKNESEGERRKRLEKEEKEREEGRKFVKEVADAYDFRLVGSEVIDGRDTWVLDAEPHPGYEPKSRNGKYLLKIKGRLWIDKAETQWVKMDVITTDTISFGAFLARIHKGTRITIDVGRINDEVWLPKHVQFHADVRLALVKNFNVDVETTFRDYKKFRSDSKVILAGEAH